MNWTLEALPPKLREQAQEKLAALGKVRQHTLQDEPKKAPVIRLPLNKTGLKKASHNTTRSTAEELFAAQLDAYKIKYEREFKFDPNRKWRSDFRIERWLIEIDGLLYGGGGRHQRPEGYGRDIIKMNAAVRAGWKPLKFTPRMVKRGQAIQVVREALRGIKELLA